MLQYFVLHQDDFLLHMHFSFTLVTNPIMIPTLMGFCIPGDQIYLNWLCTGKIAATSFNFWLSWVTPAAAAAAANFS